MVPSTRCSYPWLLNSTVRAASRAVLLCLMGHPQDIKVQLSKLPAPWNSAATDTNTAWMGPWGVSFSTNLTPDRNTGIGLWTEQMFMDTIRKGKHGGTG